MKKIKHHLSKNKSSSLVLVAVGLMVVALLVNKSTIDFVKAGISDVGGWAWGGTTSSTSPILADSAYQGIGWMSFSNTADVSTIDYGVNIPAVPPSGTLPITGEAWSEFYGWLSFNSSDVAGCPSSLAANIDSTGKITGWARFLSIKNAMNPDPLLDNAGGFDGCVSLSSTNMGDTQTYGVQKTGGAFSGYAWSPDLGWIDFSKVGVNKMVNISPLNRTIRLNTTQTISSTADFGDGTMTGHNINWKKSSSSCWNWEAGCSTNGASTLTNSTSVFSNTSSHTISNAVFTPSATGTYQFQAAATSSSPTEAMWTTSPIATITVVDPGCNYFGDLVDTGTVVTSYNSSSAPCVPQSSTCQASGSFSPALLTYKTCSDSNGTLGEATPISISVNSATINAGDKVAVTWNIKNPDNGCSITVTTASTTEKTRLDAIFSSLSLRTDTNDPYGSSRIIKTAVTSTTTPGTTNARGKVSVQLYVPTKFNLSCGGASVTPKQIQVNVTKNLEG